MVSSQSCPAFPCKIGNLCFNCVLEGGRGRNWRVCLLSTCLWTFMYLVHSLSWNRSGSQTESFPRSLHTGRGGETKNRPTSNTGGAGTGHQAGLPTETSMGTVVRGLFKRPGAMFRDEGPEGRALEGAAGPWWPELSVGGTEAGGSGRRSWVGPAGSSGNDGLFSEKMRALAGFVHASDLV